MLHQASPKTIYENHHLDILDHLDNHSASHDDFVQSSHYYKKSNISSTSSPEPHHMMQPIQQFRVIKDGRQMFEDGYRVSSSEPMMGPPPTPTKSVKIINSELQEPTSSIPDLGKFYCEQTFMNVFKWSGAETRQNR